MRGILIFGLKILDLSTQFTLSPVSLALYLMNNTNTKKQLHAAMVAAANGRIRASFIFAECRWQQKMFLLRSIWRVTTECHSILYRFIINTIMNR
jgi:hypothetical protein